MACAVGIDIVHCVTTALDENPRTWLNLHGINDAWTRWQPSREFAWRAAECAELDLLIIETQ
eukprot:SAG31_NODE_38872_length_292_cov_1.590674_1_plen_61_part_10